MATRAVAAVRGFVYMRHRATRYRNRLADRVHLEWMKQRLPMQRPVFAIRYRWVVDSLTGPAAQSHFIRPTSFSRPTNSVVRERPR